MSKVKPNDRQFVRYTESGTGELIVFLDKIDDSARGKYTVNAVNVNHPIYQIYWFRVLNVRNCNVFYSPQTGEVRAFPSC